MSSPAEAARIGEAISRMQEALRHRGPDDRGGWESEGFGFGMTRLSIIDLAGGHQPMWDDESGIGLVYNGELYNFRSLREHLQREGARFRTSSDTEVALKSFVHGGLDAVARWNGMFAAAFWETRTGKLTLLRDRLGVKPLYYFWDGTQLLFASEIRALLASGRVPARLDRQAIWDYLTFRYVPPGETVFENVFKLPPGHSLEWSRGAPPQVRRYWGTDVVGTDDGLADVERQKQFDELFLDAVELRLLASDVPVGVMLSGGLDSSAVAAAAVELGHRRFHTFSVGFAEGGRYSELAHARAVADHIGAEYHEVVLDRRSFLELLPEAVRAADEPLADLTMVPLLALSRLARGFVKVALSGEGSDEVLGGYDLDVALRRWQLAARLQNWPAPARSVALWSLRLAGGRATELAQRIAAWPLERWNRELRVHMTRHWRQTAKRALWPAFDGADSDRLLLELYDGARSKNPLEQLLSVYQRSWLVEDLLMKADKMSMAASIELRVPFLDYRLVEWANRQPAHSKVKRMGAGRYETKHLLRRFAAQRLPKAIVDRPKQGFPVPAYDWLRDEAFASAAADRLLGKQSRLAPAFRREVVEQELAAARQGDSEAAHRTWVLLILEEWLGQYGVELA